MLHRPQQLGFLYQYSNCNDTADEIHITVAMHEIGSVAVVMDVSPFEELKTTGGAAI